MPVLAITGPRQSGKTTLVKHLFSNYHNLNPENPVEREYAETDPSGFLKNHLNFTFMIQGLHVTYSAFIR